MRRFYVLWLVLVVVVSAVTLTACDLFGKGDGNKTTEPETTAESGERITVEEIELLGGYYTGEVLASTIRSAEPVRDGRGKFTQGKSVYEGEWVNGKKCGMGTMDYGTGDVYVGHWLDNNRDGVGTYTYANGNKYEGNWKNNKMGGTGTFTWKKGDVYTGEWVENKRTGQGVMTFAKGAVLKYEGEFLDNDCTGIGTVTYRNGDVYEGRVLELVRNGQGVMTYQNGDKYDGAWANDKKNGAGTYYYNNGDQESGNYVDGNLQGAGTYTWANKNQYKGNFTDGAIAGAGTLTFEVGDTLKGEFVAGNAQNGSVYTWANGDSYTGAFANNKPQGDGVKTYKNGDVFTGVVSNGEPSNGTLVWKNGDEYVGAFADNLPNDANGTLRYAVKDDAGKVLYDVFVGKVVDGAMGGNGTYTWAKSGDSYTGAFQNGMPNGEGVKTIVSEEGNATLTGTFLNGELSGAGTYAWPNGNSYTGLFADNLPNDANGTLRFAAGKDEAGNAVYDVFEGNVVNAAIGSSGTIVYANGNAYTGTFEDGVPTNGTLTYANGNIYVGKLVGGIPNDENGQMKYKVGQQDGEAQYDVFVGKIVDGQMGVVGKMQYANGNVFDGQWSEGVWAKGELIYANKDVFNGEFTENGQLQSGTFTWAESGNVYVGKFVDGTKRTDVGALMKYKVDEDESGAPIYDEFTGSMKDGVKETGTYVWAKDGNVYIGVFEDDGFTSTAAAITMKYKVGKDESGNTVYNVFTGTMSDLVRLNGTYTFDGNVFVGEFQDNAIYNGTLTYKNGDIYTGTLVDGAPQGKNCTMKYVARDGEGNPIKVDGQQQYNVYTGDFAEGGHFSDAVDGTYTWYNGDKFEGKFKDDAIYSGTLTYNNKDEYTGTFANWEKSGTGTYKHWVADDECFGDQYVGPWKNDKMDTTDAGDATGTYTYYNKTAIQYVGTFKEDMRVRGMLTTADGQYVGAFKQDKDNNIMCDGVFAYNNGNIYTGKYNDKEEREDTNAIMQYKVGVGEDDKPVYDVLVGVFEGGVAISGTMTYNDGNVYVGKLNANAQPEDTEGLLTYASKDTFTGTFVGGRATYGTYTWQESGNTYEGPMSNNLPHGDAGTKTYAADKLQYVGQFDNGDRSGKGQLYKYNDENKAYDVLVYDGDWAADKKHGTGTYYDYDNNAVYDGAFVENAMTGKAKLTYTESDVNYLYDGDFVDGVKVGSGQWYRYNETTQKYDILVYDGEWSNNQFEGTGTRYYENGDRYEGQWLNGLRHGKGTLYLAGGGSTGEVDWVNGEKV